ncbi:ribonucleotide-diphosphate reductase subunit beta [Streptomyces sp. CHB9.2]|uniref:ribonucleotide-diphosphate reductase subunit beta n=1 Tax=Streptomyces sp. CHB9.2 TaxID=2841670 RepID=UPI002096474C|nr:ribonucleotide-diphosphate reductase subunit beta [Streptomyces sp. CHB9.2]MCO6704779.1 ribonucleotide-diphosphate reductase subunit beta [Streptomyces sp. CHB9.2]
MSKPIMLEMGFPATPPVIDQAIFNLYKNDYQNTSLLLGEPGGLFDTVNKKFPDVWKLYKTMKSLDWDENEIPFTSCNAEFKNPLLRTKAQKMIKSLAWQWEADSVASRSISHIVSLFNPAPELWAAWQRISDNEVVHAATYSEIVRASFDNPRDVLDKILEITEAMQRLESVSREMAWIRERGLKFQLGLVPNDQETYNAIFMFAFVMLVLERLQFMASFAVTFALAAEDLFIPIGKMVQKIAQDEFEVHTALDFTVLYMEMQTERGQIAYEQLRPRMNALLNEVIHTEMNWSDFVFVDDETGEYVEDLKYCNRKQLKDFVLFNATFIARSMRLDMEYPQVENLPLHYMKTWMNMGDTQPSPQEQANAQYKVNVVVRDDADVEFDLSGI